MTKWILGVVIAALIVLSLATSVRAYPFTPRLNLAYRIAINYWGQEPAHCTTIDREIVPDAALPSGDLGWATIPPVGIGSEATPCNLYIARSLVQRKEFAVACKVMIHEVGHLHGLQHSSDPTSVMHPGVEPASIPPICVADEWRLSRITELRWWLNQRLGPKERVAYRDDLERVSEAFWSPLLGG